MTAERCAVCGKPLCRDEIAVTKKLISRGATSFLCVACLADHFEVKPQDIRERIDHFRATGCTLFAHAPDLDAESPTS